MAVTPRRIPARPKARTAKRPPRARACRKAVRRPRARRPPVDAPAAPVETPVPQAVRLLSVGFVLAGACSLVAVVISTILVAHTIQFAGDDRLRLGLAAGALLAVPFSGLLIAVGAELGSRARWAWRAAIALCVVGAFFLVMAAAITVVTQAWRSSVDLGPTWFQAASAAIALAGATLFLAGLRALTAPSTLVFFNREKPGYHQA